jgi:class 3 adenylate cyclase/tetratricopeptide (TPR) repeat protein
MECPNCQFENRESAKFCKECGTNLELACSGCGAVYEIGSRFCDECGYSLIQEAQVDNYESTSPGEGERKHVTVLFSDLSGYTAMSEKLDPEELKDITGRLFDDVSKIVSKYDGFVEKYAGDAVMALFGANQSHEDDPVRAIKSAKEIHNAVEALSPQYEKKIGHPLAMHTGVNTGLVVTGEINLEKGVHGVAGDTINVAARLSSAAAAGVILVDHETYTRSEGYFKFENLDPVQLKGKTNAVEVHRYLGTRDQPQKIHRLHGLRAELIGRRAEMAQLSEAVDNLSRGKGSVFSIIGAAGTGKSRLVEEFKSTLNLAEVQWRIGHAFPYSQNIPYFPLIDLINRTLHIDEGDSPEKIREKIESRIEFLLGEKSDVAPFIGSLYALSYPEIETVSPEYWKSKLQQGMLTVFSALAQRGPTIICLEDLHWADPSSLDLVRFLLSEIREPIIFLCVYRPIITLFSSHQINSLLNPYFEIALTDLSRSDSQEMVQSLLKSERIPPELQRFIQEKVEGNPFYVEEVINSLIESDLLVRDNGSWRVTQQIGQADISSTIHGVISARVDRLEQQSKRILQEASVIGRSFYFEILKRISELKEGIDRCLSGLERLDLIKARSIQPELEYFFKHALTQEVVYNGLLKKERRKIHERTGKIIEQLYHDRLPEFYEALSYHFKMGQSIHRAIDYLMKSGQKSLRRYALNESNQYYQEAFGLLTKKMADFSMKEKRLLIHLLVEWALVFYYRGDFKGLNELFSAHENFAAAVEKDETVGMFFAWLGFALYFRGKPQESYQYLQKALKIGEQIQSQLVIGYACTWLAFACVGLGLFDEGIAYGKRAKDISNSIPKDQYLYFKSRGALGFVYFYQGDRSETYNAGKTILEYGQRHSNIRSQVMGYWVMAFSYILDGDHAAIFECLEKALQISTDPFYSQFVKLSLGNVYTASGDFSKAEPVLNDVASFSRTFGCEIFLELIQPDLDKIRNSKMELSEK